MQHLNVRIIRRAVLTACITATAAMGATPLVEGLPNFQKVNDSVYRGGQPTSDGFKKLAALGVKTVIDLRLADEHSQADERNWAKSGGMNYISVPLHGMSAPSEADVKKVLAILNDPAAGPVFVHCRRGADRTGTIMACYRISHDSWKNDKALKEARGYGMNPFERAMMHYVKHYSAPTAVEATTVADSK
jgi:uncharacterized protein (TIGR01244 family)